MPTIAVDVQAVASKGSATAGNNGNADILVLVTDIHTGAGVANLTQANFNVVEHFGVVGQLCGFSGNITGFNNTGTGAYHINVATHNVNPPPGGCKWTAGDHLGQVMVKSPQVEGQGAFVLRI